MTPSRRVLDSLTLADMAIDNRIYVVRCHLCRRTEHYLAVDLVTVFGAERRANGVFDVCSHCGKSEYVRVSTRLPGIDDEGRLRLRRPVSHRVVWTWGNAIYKPAPQAPVSDFWSGRGPLKG